jgi:hypothetical protein
VTLPPDVPAARFWSLTAYNNETRSTLHTPQRYPRAGSQSYPTPAATADDDGSTTVVFGPERPADSLEGNWIQTTEGKGLVRAPAPLQPAPVVLRQDLATERNRAREVEQQAGEPKRCGPC